MIKRTTLTVAVAAALAWAPAAFAKATAQEVERLGKDATPVGAERAANKEGTIPAWDGGLTKAPAGFDAKKGYADPYAGDKPLLVETLCSLLDAMAEAVNAEIAAATG